MVSFTKPESNRYTRIVKSKNLDKNEVFWINLLNKTEDIFNKEKITVDEFKPYKEARYSRATSCLKGVRYTYAIANETAWVELTISSKKRKHIYANLLQYRHEITKEFSNRTNNTLEWDKEAHYFGKEDRNDIRITSDSPIPFTDSAGLDERLLSDLTNRMVALVKSIEPCLQKYNKLLK